MCIKPPCSSVSSESLYSEYVGNWLGNWFNEQWDTDESMTCSAENANTALDNDVIYKNNNLGLIGYCANNDTLTFALRGSFQRCQTTQLQHIKVSTGTFDWSKLKGNHAAVTNHTRYLSCIHVNKWISARSFTTDLKLIWSVLLVILNINGSEFLVPFGWIKWLICPQTGADERRWCIK